MGILQCPTKTFVLISELGQEEKLSEGKIQPKELCMLKGPESIYSQGPHSG